MIEKTITALIGVVLWCLGLMLSGLVLRINWEIFMIGWRTLG